MPNAYIIPNERLTILEAVAMAGDFTAYVAAQERAAEEKRLAEVAARGVWVDRVQVEIVEQVEGRRPDAIGLGARQWDGKDQQDQPCTHARGWLWSL